MQYHKGIELSVIGLNVFADLSPVFHSHIAGVKQRIVLQYAVEDTVLLGGQLTSVCDSAERERERERVRENFFEILYKHIYNTASID